MAVSYTKLGTPLTFTISLHSGPLASGAAYQSTYKDLADVSDTTHVPTDVRLDLLTKLQATPTAGTLVRVGVSFSNSATSGYAGGLSGADGAYSDLQDFENCQHRFEIIMDNDTNAQQGTWDIPVSGRYMSVVVYNASTGAAMTSTAGDHVLTATPRYFSTAA